MSAKNEGITHRSILLRWWDVRTAHVLFSALLLFLAVGFVIKASDTLVLFLFAMLFAYFLDPMVGKIEGPVRGRGRAIAVVFSGFVLVVMGMMLWAGPRIEDEALVLNRQLPELVAKASDGHALTDFASAHGIAPARVDQAREFLKSHKEDFYKLGPILAHKISGPLSHIYWLLLVPILGLFLLKDAHDIKLGIVGMADDGADRGQLEDLLSTVNRILGSYVRAQMILAVISLVAFALFLTLTHVPYSFALSALAGLAEFIPVVGPAAAAVTIVLICLLTGYEHLLWLVVFIGVFRATIDYVISPRIMGNSLELSPLASIFGVLAGAEIAGVVGALVSVPLLAVLRGFWVQIRTTGRRADGRQAAEAGAPHS